MTDKMKDNIVVTESLIQGMGAFAGRDFRKDELIHDIDCSNVIDDPASLPPEVNHEHLDILPNGTLFLMPPPEVYINHSCEPNTYTRTVNGIYGYYAMRSILEGEELTVHASINSFQDWEMECHCGEPNCLGKIPGDFFKLPQELQVKFLPWLDDWFRKEHEERLTRLKT